MTNLTPEQRAEYERLCEALATQDNAITNEPIFMVERRVKNYGYDYGYADAFEWFDDEGDSVTEQHATRLENRYLQSGAMPKGYERVGCKTLWEAIQPFLTRAGAEQYIESQKYNVIARVYTHSGHNNPEWKWLRRALPAALADIVDLEQRLATAERERDGARKALKILDECYYVTRKCAHCTIKATCKGLAALADQSEA